MLTPIDQQLDKLEDLKPDEMCVLHLLTIDLRDIIWRFQREYERMDGSLFFQVHRLRQARRERGVSVIRARPLHYSTRTRLLRLFLAEHLEYYTTSSSLLIALRLHSHPLRMYSEGARVSRSSANAKPP